MQADVDISLQRGNKRCEGFTGTAEDVRHTPTSPSECERFNNMLSLLMQPHNCLQNMLAVDIDRLVLHRALDEMIFSQLATGIRYVVFLSTVCVVERRSACCVRHVCVGLWQGQLLASTE